jgi:hypothetical protein
MLACPVRKRAWKAQGLRLPADVYALSGPGRWLARRDFGASPFGSGGVPIGAVAYLRAEDAVQTRYPNRSVGAWEMRRCRRTEARQRSLGRPGAAERGQRGGNLPIAGFDPCLGQESSLDLRAGPQGPAERRDPAVRLLPPRSPAWLRPDMMTSDLIPRPASSRGNRRAAAEQRGREPGAAMKRPGRRRSWPSGARPIGSRSTCGGAMLAGRAGGCRKSRTEGTPKECIRCLQDGRFS